MGLPGCCESHFSLVAQSCLLHFQLDSLSTEPPEKPQCNKYFLCDEKELEKSVDVNFIGARD